MEHEGTRTGERQRRSPLVAAAILLVVVLAATGVVLLLTRAGSGTDLGYRFASGNGATYRVTVKDTGTNMNADTEYSVTTSTTLGLEVRDVDPDGTATVVAKVGDATITGGSGDPEHLGGLAEQTARVAGDGQMLDSVVLVADPQGTFFGLLDPLLPIVSGDPVSPGDRWDVHATQGMTLGSGETTITGSATLTGFDTVDGVRVAVVHSDLTEAWDLQGDASQMAALAGGTTTSMGSVKWKGREHIRMTSLVDTDASVVVRSTLTGDYDIAITNATGDAPGSPVHNTGTFEQDAERTTS